MGGSPTKYKWDLVHGKSALKVWGQNNEGES